MLSPIAPVRPTVAIVGAGLSGTLLALNLLREAPGPDVVLVERSPRRLARGIAYATDNPRHLLNVRVSNMSAYPDDPAHFARWLGLAGTDGQNRFVERQTYGRYIRELFDEARVAHGDRFRLVQGEAVGAARAGQQWTLDLADGAQVNADLLVLAQGNLPPAELPPFRDLTSPVYRADPWAHDVGQGLGPDDEILLLGTGLTAVDVALSLDNAGFRGRITALSRRGLRPRSHAQVGPTALPVDRPDVDGANLIRHVRRRTGQVGWRTAIDELRPHMQDLWRRLDETSRKRFLRHLRPYWDVHRHRLAPIVDERISTLQMEGRLQFLAGKVERVAAEPDGALVEWRVRGSDTQRQIHVKRIVNCTGPQGDIRKCPDRLIHGLHEEGLIRSDPIGLGIDVDATGRVANSKGQYQDDLLAVGPMTRGEAWEIVAVPDIRRQVWDLARQLCHSQWVEGEGL